MAMAAAGVIDVLDALARDGIVVSGQTSPPSRRAMTSPCRGRTPRASLTPSAPPPCSRGTARRMMPPDPRDVPNTTGRREKSMEMAIGIILIVIATLEIVFIVRTVQANMGRA